MGYFYDKTLQSSLCSWFDVHIKLIINFNKDYILQLYFVKNLFIVFLNNLRTYLNAGIVFKGLKWLLVSDVSTGLNNCSVSTFIVASPVGFEVFSDKNLAPYKIWKI